MRGKEIPFIDNQLTVQDINNGPVLVVIDKGKAKLYQLPPHGRTTVSTYRGTVPGIEFKESEDF